MSKLNIYFDNNDVVVREIKENEYSDIFEILFELQTAHAYKLPNIYKNYSSIEEISKETALDNFTKSYSYVVEYKGKLAGYAFLMEGTFKNPSIYVKKKNLILEAFIINTQFRGLKLGRILLETIKIKAKENGYERIDLEVLPDNSTAISLYEALDFKSTMLKMSVDL